MKFGEKLQALRRAKGLSQEQLAELLGVTRQAISKWELNASLPDVDKLLTLSDFFAVSTDYLLRESMESPAGAAAPEAAPAPPVQPEPDPRPPLNRPLVIAGSILAGLAALALLIVWVLSRVYPSEYVEYSFDGDIVRYSFGFAGFTATHDLGGMVGVCFVLLLAGLILLGRALSRRYGAQIFAFTDREINEQGKD